MPLTIGQKAPNFTLPSTNGKNFTLDVDLVGKSCIIYFYFKNFSPGCTNEACGFRDTFDVFENLSIPVIGISRDSMESHVKFRKMLQLPFDLLSDEDVAVSKLYDTVPLLMPFFTKRTTYLLDRLHNITAVYENILSSEHHIKNMVDKVNKLSVTAKL
jgi:thioredoxin-dependent peroxiredoxin